VLSVVTRLGEDQMGQSHAALLHPQIVHVGEAWRARCESRVLGNMAALEDGFQVEQMAVVI